MPWQATPKPLPYHSALARFQALPQRGGSGAAAASGDPAEEQFAEAYSVCARYRALRQTYFGMYAYTPSPAKHRRVCSLIRTAS